MPQLRLISTCALLATLGLFGCDRNEQMESHAAFGKQLDVNAYSRPGRSILDRVEDPNAGDDAVALPAATATGARPESSVALSLRPSLGVGAVSGTMFDEAEIKDDKNSPLTSVDLRMLVDRTVDADYKERFDRGQEYMNQGDFARALRAFEEAKTLNPANYHAYVGESYCYFQTGDYGKASAAIEFAIAREPEKIDLYTRRAMIRFRLGDFGKAIDDYTRCIAANPKDVALWAARAQCHVEMRNYQSAIADYTAALKEKRDDPTLLISRGVAYFRRQLLREAADDATAAMEQQPSMIDAHFLRAICRLYLQDAAGGRTDFDTAVRLGLPQNAVQMWRPAFYPSQPGPAGGQAQPAAGS